MSTLPPKADIAERPLDVCFVPKHALQQFCRYSITRSAWPSSESGIQEEISIDKDFKFAAVQRL